MDRYTKAVLTIIAVSLSVIALRMFEPQEAHAGRAFLSAGPTYGQIVSLREVKDDAERRQAYRAILRRVPLVQVQGGSVDAEVSGSVEIDH